MEGMKSIASSSVKQVHAVDRWVKPVSDRHPVKPKHETNITRRASQHELNVITVARDRARANRDAQLLASPVLNAVEGITGQGVCKRDSTRKVHLVDADLEQDMQEYLFMETLDIHNMSKGGANVVDK